MSSYFQSCMPHIMFDGSCQYFQESNTVLHNCLEWSLLNELDSFPVHGIPNTLFFQCYLIPETTATTVQWLQIRYNVIFRLLGYCTCENVMGKPSRPVKRLGKKIPENMLTYKFFLLLKTKQLALQSVHTIDQEIHPLLKR